MNNIYLSTQSKVLSTHFHPLSVNIVNKYLIESIVPGNNDIEIEINKFTTHKNYYNTFGSTRLEILFYEKTISDQRREQITLYGIAENIYSQLKSFTICCDTCWCDNRNRHTENKYFESIIIDRFGSSPIIAGFSQELILRNADSILIGHCSIILRFDPDIKSRKSSAIPPPVLSASINRPSSFEYEKPAE